MILFTDRQYREYGDIDGFWIVYCVILSNLDRHTSIYGQVKYVVRYFQHGEFGRQRCLPDRLMRSRNHMKIHAQSHSWLALRGRCTTLPR